MLTSCLMTSIDFAEWLQKQLDERGFTPYKLAQLSGKDQGTISRILNRERMPGNSSLIAFAKALKLPRDVVFEAAGILSPDSADTLSASKQYLWELAKNADDNTVELMIAMLEADLKRKK